MLFGGTLAAAGANTINCVCDRDIDEKMKRTHGRPLPLGLVTPEQALRFGIGLEIFAFVWLWATTNLLAATLAVSATAFYVFVYTMWLKRTTAQNIVIGGAAGAVPVLVGWAAVTGKVGLPAWVMFTIIFMWTPPHFWALAMKYKDDYAAAGVPMLPVTAGPKAAARQILAYSVVLVGVTLTLCPAAQMGPVYLVAAVVLGARFLQCRQPAQPGPPPPRPRCGSSPTPSPTLACSSPPLPSTRSSSSASEPGRRPRPGGRFRLARLRPHRAGGAAQPASSGGSSTPTSGSTRCHSGPGAGLRAAVPRRPDRVAGRLPGRAGRCVNFWGAWCEQCTLQLPLLAEMKRRFPAVPIVGILFQEDPEVGRAAAAHGDATWPDARRPRRAGGRGLRRRPAPRPRSSSGPTARSPATSSARSPPASSRRGTSRSLPPEVA